MHYPKHLYPQIKKIEYYHRKYPHPDSHLCYGLGKWLKKSLAIPDCVPLSHIHMDHGVPPSDELSNIDLATNRPAFFIREAKQKKYYSYTGKEAYVTGSPFIFCRKFYAIRRDADASGTVAFPVHSTHLIDVLTDWEEYATNLLILPKPFHPITVCLYWKDILEGHFAPFSKRGLSVVTAGHMADPEFPLNFYHILKCHKFSTSNLVGSYAFYSIEMDIPFFIY
ncbi:MAG: hypothetical protein HQK65_08665, partial [Desulfamplus sp.]|nr:hypothetical protein [Desulfamplus sp.]